MRYRLISITLATLISGDTTKKDVVEVKVPKNIKIGVIDYTIPHHLIYYQKHFDMLWREHYFMSAIDAQTLMEGVSYDTVDIYNYYNGQLVGTRWGMTYIYFYHMTNFGLNVFIMSDRKTISYYFYIINHEHIKNMSIHMIYIYAFYVFRFNKYTFIYDYQKCVNETGMYDMSSIYVFECVLEKFNERYRQLMKENPYYRLGFYNRYINYYKWAILPNKEKYYPNI